MALRRRRNTITQDDHTYALKFLQLLQGLQPRPLSGPQGALAIGHLQVRVRRDETAPCALSWAYIWPKYGYLTQPNNNM